MPRSASDATRFTSTTPHAAKPFYPASANPGQALGRSTAPAGETPQQKVRRLRAAASRAKEAHLTTFDKVVVNGRVWADRAHRFTALTLIGITGVAGVVTVYALGDMIIYNRRKQKEYFTEQRAIQSAALHDAQVALRAGLATSEQLILLTQEGKLPTMSQTNPTEKIATAQTGVKPGMFATAKSWLFSGLKKEEDSNRLGFEMSEEDDSLGESESGILRAIEARKLEVANKARLALEREKETQKTGGPLDRIGTENEGRPGVKENGWTSFMSRK